MTWDTLLKHAAEDDDLDGKLENMAERTLDKRDRNAIAKDLGYKNITQQKKKEKENKKEKEAALEMDLEDHYNDEAYDDEPVLKKAPAKKKPAVKKAPVKKKPAAKKAGPMGRGKRVRKVKSFDDYDCE